MNKQKMAKKLKNKFKRYITEEVKIKRLLRDALIIYCFLSVIVGINLLNNLPK